MLSPRIKIIIVVAIILAVAVLVYRMALAGDMPGGGH